MCFFDAESHPVCVFLIVQRKNMQSKLHDLNVEYDKKKGALKFLLYSLLEIHFVFFNQDKFSVQYVYSMHNVFQCIIFYELCLSIYISIACY